MLSMRPATSKSARLRPRYVCLQCQQQGRQEDRRNFSQTSRRPAPEVPSPPSTGLAWLSSRGLLSLSGPDAAKYLQGMITQNVSTTLLGPVYAAFLNAQGRILHDVFVYQNREHDKELGIEGYSFLIDVDAAETERLHKHIRRHKLRAKFETRVVDPAELRVWALWDDEAEQSTLETRSHTTALFDPRAPSLGMRLVHRTSGPGSLGLDRELVPETAYTVRRYLAGLAEGQEELLNGQALPHESNLDVMSGVDFHKGCYVGQELTIRTQHRGVVRKRVLPCMLYAEGHAMPTRLTYQPTFDTPRCRLDRASADMVPGGTSIRHVGKTGRSAGKWLRGVGNLGLALCRLEIMTDMVVTGETSVYAPEDEFVVCARVGGDKGGADQVFKIKAFVPDWLRHRLVEKAY